MSRGVKRRPVYVEPELPVEPYPQHAKMFQFVEKDWAI